MYKSGSFVSLKNWSISSSSDSVGTFLMERRRWKCWYRAQTRWPRRLDPWCNWCAATIESRLTLNISHLPLSEKSSRNSMEFSKARVSFSHLLFWCIEWWKNSNLLISFLVLGSTTPPLMYLSPSPMDEKPSSDRICWMFSSQS